VGATIKFDHSQPAGVGFDVIEPLGRYPIYPCPDWVDGEQNALFHYAFVAQNPKRITLESINSAIPQTSCKPEKVDWAEPILYHPGNIVFSSSASSGGYVLVDETWYPGWSASVDGKNASIYRANYLFMAIYVPAGKHEIRLDYRSTSFTIGAILSILMLIFLIHLTYKGTIKPQPGTPTAMDIARRN
jgi:hypothetical protein